MTIYVIWIISVTRLAHPIDNRISVSVYQLGVTEESKLNVRFYHPTNRNAKHFILCDTSLWGTLISANKITVSHGPLFS